MHLLIPYVLLPNHEDPLFSEFTYGDIGGRAKKLKTLSKGDHIFFHTAVRGKKYITAYYVLHEVSDVAEAVNNENICVKYHNPHLKEYIEGKTREKYDVILFGDQLESRVLRPPLLFNKELANKLSLGITFRDGLTETQCIGSATRSWRELTNQDVKILKEEISKISPFESRTIVSTDEVDEILETDLENLLEGDPKILTDLLGENIRSNPRRQVDSPVGRMDMVFETKSGKMVVIELKLNNIGNDAIAQLRRYINYLEKSDKAVMGVLVCKGVMPAFEEKLRHELSNPKSKIKLLKYGWELKVIPGWED